MTRSRILFVLIALALAILLAHGPSLRGGFLRFDDDRILTANPLFDAPMPEALLGIFHPARTIADAYLPISHLSLWLDWKMFGPEPTWLHLSNLIWHLLACLALFALGKRLGLSTPGAFLASLVFAVHPALGEPVAWVSGRKCLLAGLFSFLTLICWLDALAGRRLRGIGAALFALLAVYSNGAALVLLPWILLLSLLYRRSGRKALPWVALGLIAFFCIGAGFHHAWLAAREGTAGSDLGRPAALAVGSLAWYLGRSFLPIGFSSDYPYAVYQNSLSAAGLFTFLLALAPILAASILWGFRRRLGRFPWAAAVAGLLLFFLGLTPFNNVYPATSVLLADRYFYLPLAGLVLAAGTLLSLPGSLRWASGALLVVSLLVLVPVTRVRSAQFKDDQALWQAALSVEPASAVARFNLVTDLLHRKGRSGLQGESGRKVREDLSRALGDAQRPQLRSRILAQIAVIHSWSGQPLQAAGSLSSAMDELDRLPESAVRIRAWGRLALDRLRYLRQAGAHEDALSLTARIRELLPLWPEGRIGLASLQVMQVEALLHKGETTEAEALALVVKSELEHSLASGPPSFETLLALSRLEATRLSGFSFLRALALLGQARDLEPSRIESYIEMANLYQQLDPPELDAAMQELNLGLRRRPGDPDLLLRKGHLLVNQGRIEAGLPWIEQALAAHPGREDLRDYLLGTLLLGLEEALQDRARKDPIAWLRRLQSLDRYHPEVLKATGKTLAAGGQLREAVDFLEQALAKAARPDETRALLVETLKKLGYQQLLAHRDKALDSFHRAATLAEGSEELQAVRGILDGEVRKLWLQSRTLLASAEPLEALRPLAKALSLVLPKDQPAAALVLEMERAGLEGAPIPDALRARAREILAAELAGAPTPEQVSLRVETWLSEGKSSQALWVLELLERQAGPLPLWVRLKARTLLARGEFAHARTALEQGLEQWPETLEIQEDLGRLICQEALAQWQAAPSEEALERLVQGTALCRHMFVRQALEPLLAGVDTVLRNQSFLALEGADQAREEGQWLRAADLYARGVRLMPPGVEPEFRYQASMLRALCWRDLGQPLRTLSDLEALDREARRAAFPFGPVVRARAALLYTLERPVEARQVLESWLAAFPKAQGRAEVEALLPDPGR